MDNAIFFNEFFRLVGDYHLVSHYDCLVYQATSAVSTIAAGHGAAIKPV